MFDNTVTFHHYTKEINIPFQSVYQKKKDSPLLDFDNQLEGITSRINLPW